MKADWPKIKIEYINGTMSMRELAEAHGIKPAGLFKQAAAEKWKSERKQKSIEVSKKANDAIEETRAEQLSKFNYDDIKVARALRGRAAQKLNNEHLSPYDLSSLARVFEVAQKIGRLALGASTESSEVNNVNPLVLKLETDEGAK